MFGGCRTVTDRHFLPSSTRGGLQASRTVLAIPCRAQRLLTQHPTVPVLAFTVLKGVCSCNLECPRGIIVWIEPELAFPIVPAIQLAFNGLGRVVVQCRHGQIVQLELTEPTGVSFLTAARLVVFTAGTVVETKVVLSEPTLVVWKQWTLTVLTDVLCPVHIQCSLAVADKVRFGPRNEWDASATVKTRVDMVRLGQCNVVVNAIVEIRRDTLLVVVLAQQSHIVRRTVAVVILKPDVVQKAKWYTKTGRDVGSGVAWQRTRFAHSSVATLQRTIGRSIVVIGGRCQ